MFERGKVSEIDEMASKARIVLANGTVTAPLPGHELIVWPSGEPEQSPPPTISVGMTVSVLFYAGAGYSDGLILGEY